MKQKSIKPKKEKKRKIWRSKQEADYSHLTNDPYGDFAGL